jgi:predicted glycogen debranching enzyme
MSMNPLLQLKRHAVSPPPDDAPLEWLVSNGLGGYAFGSVQGPPLRRFHGLLIAAHPAPVGRVLLLHALEETVHFDDGTTVALRPGRGAGEHAELAEFFLQAGLPRWTFQLRDGICVEQSLLMPHGQNTVHVRYCLTGPTTPARLTIRPWLDFRPHEGSLDGEQRRRYEARELSPARCEFTTEGADLVLRMQMEGPVEESFDAAAADWHDVPYDVERERGYDHRGSAHAPGVFVATLHPGRDVYVTASSEPWDDLDALPPQDACRSEMSRREHLLTTSDLALQAPETFLLPLAADQFIIRPTRTVDEAQARAVGAEPRTVIAGYPWFTDWGRDTMISLEGLTLVTGRHHEARDILRTFALHVRDGLIPNLFPEGQQAGLYHTADATLWFFHAVHRYDVVSGDHSLVQELLPTLETIVRCHQEGTHFNIRVDDDGLLSQGAEGYQLTWMDAKVDGWVVTPRRGKPVEINALWYNALMLLQSWLVREGRGLLNEGLARDARRCRESFNARFWNASERRLNDVVDGEGGDDAACRPNQLVVFVVEHSPLDRPHWKPVLEAVTDELLTPLGLRTLSPRHPDYKARYFGDLRTRDAAYHQGTVWPWLIGPFIDAWFAVHPHDADTARALITPLLQHVTNGACIGSVSEICDAESPFTPRGCVAQAWSVAELARAVVKVQSMSRRGGPP